MTRMNAETKSDPQVTLRDATESDLPAINDIYNHYVHTCTCTWQQEEETAEARRAWFALHTETHPVIVAVLAGEIVGWGALSPFRRTAMVENSVYVRTGFQRRGIGSVILKELVARAKALSHHSIVAVISGDRAASIALHANFGFVEAGRLLEAGYKFGKRLDLYLMHRMLSD